MMKSMNYLENDHLSYYHTIDDKLQKNVKQMILQRSLKGLHS